MKSRTQIWLILLFTSISFYAFSTHIAGGSLSYVYNGGNSYTFTLALYRDCCPTCAAYPGNVPLTILNGDGSASGINLTLNPGTATQLPDSLPHCAVPPNPLPCIQQRFYTGNVTLPLKPGGYHIYYSLCCRNGAVINIQNPLNTGEDFYANVPGPYTIDFNLPNGTTVGNDSSGTGWTNTFGATPPNYAKVNNGVFDVSGANSATDTWASTVIPISTYTAGVTLSALLSETGGGFTNTDSLQIYYSLNGGPKIHFNTNGTEVSGFGTKTATTNTLVGNTIQIFATFKFQNPSSANQIFGLDNVSVIPVQWNYTSSPAFGVAPPLFLCQGQPFTTNYSATELDGDSLVYSFYTPSDGNGPTVSNDIATYQPVSWIAGYSAQSAFNAGGPGLSLNPSTGILSGTPNTVGIFVVGVQVSAYKNGVFVDAVVRDFQFNVVTCPQSLGLSFSTSPAQPVICFGQTTTVVSAIGTGGIPPYTYLWNNSVTGQTVNLGEGTYTVELNDATNCQPIFGTVTVTSYTVPTTANAGASQTICSQNPITVLSGTVTGAATTTWSGGAGSYAPNNTSLNATYTPTAAEVAAGHVTLTLTASVPTCPSATGTVTINYQGFLGTPSIAENNVTCFGFGNGSATASVAGGDSPYSYFWSNSKTTATISGLAPATYSVTITDAIGCTAQISTTVNQPSPLSLGSVITNDACNGISTGAIAITPVGGTSPYTYLWAPGNQTTSTISGQAAGTYSVSVIDSKGCDTSSSYTITQPTALSVANTSTNVSCFNGNNGTITTTSVSGGTSPYSYNWSSGATSPNLTGLQAGTYTLTITDFHNCSITNTVTITQPTQLTTSTAATNQTCSYLSNGTATVTATGGTAGYTYLWNTSSTTPTITGLASGTYTVTATDSKGCTANTTATISQPPLLTVSFIDQVNVSCKGGNNGAVTATSTGGTANYSYAWQPGGQTTASVNGFTAGTYTVTSTDAKGCTATNTITITEPTLLTVSTTVTNQTCSYLSNGTATATAGGGTAGYTYLWQPMGATTTTVNGLSSGTYTVISTDSKGCTASTTATITKPASLVVNFPSQTNVSCKGGSNGTVTALASGGTAGYSYTWQTGGQTTASISGLSAGTYTATATDINGCTGFNTVIITQPTQLTASTTVTNQTCSYLSNGTATVTATGGTAGYTYLWNTSSTTPTITGLASGSYTVMATDSKGCTANRTVTISQPPLLTVSFIDQVNVSCKGGNNGAVTATSTGGTANYSYSWQPGGQTTASVNGLTAGTYTVTSTDAKGCTATNTITITEPTLLTVSTTVTNQTCSYLSNGTATATAGGGTAGYTYLWQPMGATTTTVNGLSSGTYTVISTDSKGCTASATATITKPASLVVNFPSQTNVSCKGGSNGTVTALASGGTAGYSYTWQTGGQTTASISGLSAGTYTATATDINGCTGFNTVIITQPTQLTASTTVTNQTCSYLSNGTATVTATGGTAGYSYLWQASGQTTATIIGLAAGMYTVTATDSKGCTANTTATITQPPLLTVSFIDQVNVSCKGGNNGAATATSTGGTSNYSYIWQPGGQTTASVNGFTAGTYTVTSTDANACTATNIVTITQPTQLTVGVSSTSVTCAGGSNGGASATAIGGNGPYNYTWMIVNLTTQSISSLKVGTYSVTVIDANGCSATNVVNVSQPAVISLTVTTVNSKCSFPTGQASIVASGGAGPPYTYNWSTGATTSTINNLFSGIYSVSVTDVMGCQGGATGNVNDSTSALITLKSLTDVSCFGGANGSISISLLGGDPPYSFSWSNNVTGDSVISNLPNGVYTVTVTPANNCKSFFSQPIYQPSEILTEVSTANVSCRGGNNGTASVVSFLATPGYSYLWMPGGTTGSSVNGLSAGSYTVQTTDANNCILETTYTITEPPASLTVGVSSSTALCNGESDGGVSAIANGGTSPYSYIWMPGSLAEQNLTDLPAGSYTVMVTDYNSCVATNTVTIIQPTAVSLVMDSINSNCSLANGQASVVATGGTGTYTYQWSPTGGTNAIATGLLAGTYSVTVTDANGCKKTSSTTVNDNPSPSANVSSTTNVSCNGGNNATATVTVTSGTSPFTYSWSPTGGTNATATGLSIGTYTVIVTDKNGCTSNAAVSSPITQPFSITTEITTTNVSCKGGNNGAASVVSFGGTSGYTYLWLPGGTSGSSINGLSAGTYTVQTIDANNCIKIEVYTITEPTLLTVGVSSTTVLCNGESDGGVSSTASGGTSPYSYIWMPGNLAEQNLTDLPVGTYTVTVTDVKLCTATNTVTVTQPTAISLVMDSINSNCSLANGQASVIATGGTGSYTYQWSPTGGTNAIATGLLADTYSVTVTDANGCKKTSSTTVNDNPSPSANVSSTTNVSCNGGNNGTATVTVTSGTSPFTYSWSPTGGTNATATGLSIGTYTVIVTDKNGCTSNAAVSSPITQPFSITTEITTTNVSCKGGNNGAASVVSFGGTPGYTYLWLPGGTSGSSINGLSAGTYTVQTTDVNNCVQITTYTITEPASLTVVILSSINVSCKGGNDGSATTSVTGGTLDYSYNWIPSGGNGPTGTGLIAGTYTVIVTDTNNCITSQTVTITEPAQALSASSLGGSVSCNGGSNGTATINPAGGTPGYSYQWSPSGGTGQSASNLSAQNYAVLVTDSKGCQTTLFVNITEPSSLVGNLVSTDPSCGFANGSVIAQISGGTEPYSYLWTPGSATGNVLTGAVPGTYTVQVTDIKNCNISLVSTALINIPGPVVSVSSETNVACFGGNNGASIININQGTAPFTINWLPYGGSSLTASSLTAGTYTANVTDTLGCISTTTVTISQPTPVNITLESITNVLCFGNSTGNITILATGGTSPYTYSWTNTAATSSTAGSLKSGLYTVLVQDHNNCQASISQDITEPLAPLSSTVTTTAPVCLGLSGSASVITSGGTMGYRYSWSSVPVQTGASATLFVGIYSLTTIDNDGCSTNNSFTINGPSKVVTKAMVVDTICQGKTAILNASATGGSGGWYYAWEPAGVINSGTYAVSPDSNTVYTVAAYDKNGCPGNVDSVKVAVLSLSNSDIQIFGKTPICPNHSSDISVQAASTTGPLTYTWNPNIGNGPGPYIVSPTHNTTYLVTISGTCGNSVTDSVQIVINPPPTINITSDTNQLCLPSTVQFFDNSVAGNINDPITSWNWNFGDGFTSTSPNPSHTYTTPGTHDIILTVSTAGGCTSSNTSAPLIVNAYTPPIAIFAVSNPDINLNLPYDSLKVKDESTKGPTISYNWSFGDGGTSTAYMPKYLYKSIGTYQIQLIVTSQPGCTDTAYGEITTTADVVFPNAFTPSAYGSSGGYYSAKELNNYVFFPYTAGVIDYRLEIFNRWGELIFVSTDVNVGWDGYYHGQLCEQDVYVWKAYVKLNNGNVFIKTGDVTLLQ